MVFLLKKFYQKYAFYHKNTYGVFIEKVFFANAFFLKKHKYL